MRRESGEAGRSATVRRSGAQEQHFYIVMHHLATVLWMKGATVEALAALSAVLEAICEPATVVPSGTAPKPETKA